MLIWQKIFILIFLSLKRFIIFYLLAVFPSKVFNNIKIFNSFSCVMPFNRYRLSKHAFLH